MELDNCSSTGTLKRGCTILNNFNKSNNECRGVQKMSFVDLFRLIPTLSFDWNICVKNKGTGVCLSNFIWSPIIGNSRKEKEIEGQML